MHEKLRDLPVNGQQGQRYRFTARDIDSEEGFIRIVTYSLELL